MTKMKSTRSQVVPALEITREKCSYAARYKGVVMPRCGCRVCWDKWEEQKLSRET